MFSVRSLFLATPMLLLALIACDRQPVEPAVPAARSAMVSSSVKAPSGTNALAVSESRIDVSWGDNSTNETGFEVQRPKATCGLSTWRPGISVRRCRRDARSRRGPRQAPRSEGRPWGRPQWPHTARTGADGC